MQEMKQRLASMTKNIDDLTDLVKKVSVKDEEMEEEEASSSPVVSPGSFVPDMVSSSFAGPGNKRKKMDMNDMPMMPDWNPSSSDLAGVDSLLLAGDTSLLPDLATSSGGSSSPIPSPAPSDDGFVDDLFQAFADEDAIIPGLEGLEDERPEEPITNPNKPDPQLMKRIEDSLSTIPRDMHEMVANKLIDAISNTQPPALEESKKVDRSISVDDAENVILPIMEDDGASTTNSAASIPLPLAVATLKTILSEYGVSVECRRSPCKDALDRSRFTKLPAMVPMHA